MKTKFNVVELTFSKSTLERLKLFWFQVSLHVCVDLSIKKKEMLSKINEKTLLNPTKLLILQDKLSK